MIFHDQIIDAINRSRELQIYYDGSIFRIEPHSYGISYIGHYVLRAFQTGCGSDDSGPFCWKSFLTSEIAYLRETGVIFNRPRPGYVLDAAPMKRIFARLSRRGDFFIDARSQSPTQAK